MLVYAIFRDKVIDLGFIVNRTLIYGIISSGLLVVFGLIEWGSERLIPHESLEASALVNAGVALGFFVVFHRIRDVVERAVERVLFRSWHDNEATLRKFIRQAAFIAKSEALAAASIAEFRRFSGGAGCALYLREGDDYVRSEGKLAGARSRIDGDDPLAVVLRADSRPLEPFGDMSNAAALALPMSHRGGLDGFVLLGAKPSGDGYRPDEIELLGWAAQQIGLDLHALKVAGLERSLSALQAHVGELQSLVKVRRASKA